MVGKIWKRAWQPTSVFLTGESHGQRSLVGCIVYGVTKSDMTEVTTRMHKDTSILYLGSKITADGDCSHEIKRCLLLGRN